MLALPTGNSSPESAPSPHASGSTTSNNLQYLPNELLTKILANLLPTGPAVDLIRPPDIFPRPNSLNATFVLSRWSLRQCSLACRALQPVAQALLFRVVALTTPEDLLLFLRVLVYRVDLRYLVRTVVWTGDFSSARLHFDNTQFELAWTIYREFQDHAPAEDVRAAALLDISHPYKLRGRPALGLLLAMVPRVRSLFLTIPSNRDPTRMTALSSLHRQDYLHVGCETTSPHPVGTVLASGPSPDAAAWAGPDGRPPYPFLQELEVVVLQSQDRGSAISHQEPRSFWRRLLDAFARSSPRLRRAEVRHSMPSHLAYWAAGAEVMPALAVREFVLYSETAHLMEHHAIHDLVPAYPELESFVVVTTTGEVLQNVRPVLEWKGTLRTLKLVSDPLADWWDPDVDPHLEEILPHLASLRHLTTELVWLFSKTRPSVRNMSSLLPSSLESLHLIDYWGDRDPETFYPHFDVEFGPFGFLDRVLGSVQDGCNSNLTHLSGVKVFSQCFDPTGDEAITERAQEFELTHLIRFSDLFIYPRASGKRSVDFHAGGMLEAEMELRESWAHVVEDYP
jgi:hypothetical protein